jgi:tRNA threonylcarbamoyladenosine biosynthesis protein TsaE
MLVCALGRGYSAPVRHAQVIQLPLTSPFRLVLLFCLVHDNPVTFKRFLAAEADTLALGAALAPCLQPGMVIYLSGELGAGKTTLARGILSGLGHTGKVKSPSYALVEPYKLSRLYLYHFDFYRFTDPEEAADAGFREYFSADAVCLVEWPENAVGMLPRADLNVAISAADSGRQIEIGYGTEAGRLCLNRLKQR